ncbi:SDR family oxidoreductase [Kribbella sp. NPDC055071]
MGVLEGKAALVTGGSRGMGAAIVRRLAADGAVVTFSYVANEAKAADVVAEVKAAGGTAFAVQADQADLSATEELFERALEPTGSLDIVVCSAAQVMLKPIADVTEEEYDHIFAINAKGPYFAIKAAGRVLSDGGRIVAISSLNTALPFAGNSLYTASKGALEQIVKIAAREYGPRGITVNTVSSGATDTDMFRDSNPPEVQQTLVAMTALGRVGQPAEVADVVAFLAGPDGRWMTGQNLRATGGLVL